MHCSPIQGLRELHARRLRWYRSLDAAVAVTVAVRPGASDCCRCPSEPGGMAAVGHCPRVVPIGHSSLRLCPDRAGGLLAQAAEGWVCGWFWWFWWSWW